MTNEKIKVKVRFNQQQMELIEKLKDEGKYGQNYQEIIVNIFREYIIQLFGVGGLE